MNKIKEKNKRILILNYEFPPLGGGGGVATKDLAKGFIENGYEVDCLTSGYGNLKKNENVDGINVFRVKTFGRKELATATFISMLTFLFFGFFKGISLCRKNKYRFINTHFAIPTGPLGFILSKFFRLKNILSIHGGDIYDPSLKRSPHKHWCWRTVVKFIISRADFVVAQSSNTKENAEKYYNFRKEISVIPLPYSKINFSKKTRNELGLDIDKKYLISVGRLVKRKGYDYLLKAFSEIKNENIELLIIGYGPEKDNLKKMADNLNVSRRVHFLENIKTDEEKFQYLDTADVYVLSSLHEGFGVVLQEAMQVGLPIVATNNGGQVDFIQSEKNGLLVEAKNSEKLAEAIKKLLANEDLAKKMRNNNIEKIEEFNSKKIAVKYLELVKK